MARERSRYLVAVITAALVLVAGQVRPGGQSAPASPSRGAAPGVGVSAYGGYEAWQMAASDSFDAVFGTSQVSGFGAGVQVTDLWRGLFARGGFATASKTGERVFVSDGQVFPLGIPLKVTLTPIEISGGWRVRASQGRFVPYGGAGVLIMRYKEESDFAESDENLDDTFTGYLVFGGLEVGLVRGLGVGAEVQYRGVHDALGAGGVSAEFGETSLGGVGFKVFAVVGTGIGPARRPAGPASRPAPPPLPSPWEPTRPLATPPAAPAAPAAGSTPAAPASAPATAIPAPTVAAPAPGPTEPESAFAVPIDESLPAWLPGHVPPQRPYEATIEVHITEAGVVDAVKFLKSSNPAWDQYVRQAVYNWRYRPARRQGLAVASTKVVSFTIEAK